MHAVLLQAFSCHAGMSSIAQLWSGLGSLSPPLRMSCQESLLCARLSCSCIAVLAFGSFKTSRTGYMRRKDENGDIELILSIVTTRGET